MDEQKTNNTPHKKRLYSKRGSIWILIVAAIVLEATACVQYFYSRAAIRHEAERRAKSELTRSELEIGIVATEVQMSVKAMALMGHNRLHLPDSMFGVTRIIVENTPNVTGAGFTFNENYYESKGKWFEPYSCEVVQGDKSQIRSEQIAGPDHDYFDQEWYQRGWLTDSCLWSEPYYDNAGAKAMLITCTCPVRDDNGQKVAVAGVDVSLSWLQQITAHLQVYPDSHFSITSANGVELVPMPEITDDRKYQTYEEYIETTNWTIRIIVPEDVIYADLRHVGIIVFAMMIIGLVVLVFIMYRTTNSLVDLINLSNRQERIDSELNIARNIQMAMLPTRFPPFPDYQNISSYGVLEPAKEVGGDLFDFYVRDDKLFFCIGDVSGKGVPSALVMAVTRSLFRSFTSYINSPAQIVSQMNESLTGEANDQNMFVTLFLGVLDLTSGDFSYCNAGHDAPILIGSEETSPLLLPVAANLPLGVLSGFSFSEQSAHVEPGDTIFLYTDGLTEAENTGKELFGMERMMNVVRQWHAGIAPQEQIASMQAAVKEFVGAGQQSDDITLFSIKYLAKCEATIKSSVKKEYHSLVMRNDIRQIPTLAEWIGMLGIPQSLEMTINLAIEEAVSNVMLYAYPPNGEGGQVLVEAEKHTEQGPSGVKSKIVFTISDTGIPFDPTVQPEPDITSSLEQRSVGGLGIFLVRQIMDEISYQRSDNKNILKLTKIL